jgi:hypothetical protein
MIDRFLASVDLGIKTLDEEQKPFQTFFQENRLIKISVKDINE